MCDTTHTSHTSIAKNNNQNFVWGGKNEEVKNRRTKVRGGTAHVTNRKRRGGTTHITRGGGYTAGPEWTGMCAAGSRTKREGRWGAAHGAGGEVRIWAAHKNEEGMCGGAAYDKGG